MISTLLPGLLFIICVAACTMEWRVAEWEFAHRGEIQNAFRYDLHRALATTTLLMAASSFSFFVSQLLQASTPFAKWEFLFLSCWISLATGIFMFSMCRFTDRYDHHPYWCGLRNPKRRVV